MSFIPDGLQRSEEVISKQIQNNILGILTYIWKWKNIQINSPSVRMMDSPPPNLAILKGLENVIIYLRYISRIPQAYTELQKDYFCPVSRFSNEKCPNHLFCEFCNNMKHKSTFRLVFYSFIAFLSWTVS